MKTPRYFLQIATGGYHRFGLTTEVVDEKEKKEHGNGLGTDAYFASSLALILPYTLEISTMAITATIVTMMAYINKPIVWSPPLPSQSSINWEMAPFHAKAATKPKAAVISATILSIISSFKLPIKFLPYDWVNS
jgi:hypothetical protein